MHYPVTLLQIKNKPTYDQSLEQLIKYIKQDDKSAIIVAPELAVTDFDYDNLDRACEFSEYAIKELCKVVTNQIVALTFFQKVNNRVVNQAVVIHKGKVVHTQNKHKLFKLGNEHLHFSSGDGKDIHLFEINGIKFGLLICFELRYKELWKKLEGADIILVPSQWGEPRKRHLEILGSALAVMNQCFVLIANASNETMAKSSAIYTPMGGSIINDAAQKISCNINLDEIKLMRRYITL